MKYALIAAAFAFICSPAFSQSIGSGPQLPIKGNPVSAGSNSDITSLSGLTTPLSFAQGGCGATSAAGCLTNLGGAASGPNADITSMTALNYFYTHMASSVSAPNNNGICPGFGYTLTCIDFEQDTVNTTSSTLTVQALTIVHRYGGTGTFGGRNSLGVWSYLNAPSDPSNTNHNWAAFNAEWTGSANDGGTSVASKSTSQGGGFGLNPYCVLKSGATNFLECTPGEANVSVQTGASVFFKAGWTVAATTSDAVQGGMLVTAGSFVTGQYYKIVSTGGGSTDFTTIGALNNLPGTSFLATGPGTGTGTAQNGYDTGYSLSNQPGAVGFNHGLLLSTINGSFPLTSVGTVLATLGGSFAHGVDFTLSTLSGNAFASKNWSVSGATGIMTIAGTQPASTPNVVFTGCGSNCGIYTTAASKFGWALGGANIWDYGETTASFFTITPAVVFTNGAFLGGIQSLQWQSRSTLQTVSDGTFLMSNHAVTGFTRLQLGGQTSSFPALQVSGAGLVAELADGSAATTFTASAYFAGATAGSTCSGTPTSSFASAGGIVTHC